MMAAGESDAKIKRFIKNSKSAFKQRISDLPTEIITILTL